ncbi:hypothetical protein N7462_002606 [Penicillium macrosclerotiorum]|uniref:uncharacterized protein n=1 Tax=Penicillium macrosclerotiorum TaxID=303699 RepID=UPI002546A47C|nr:uncharacterized protein N7462_002606 [Penicillium macrosclerotiorum]KAJ5693183.1 hypothetical protein N7462_002606 [Penicillium macrosclerotiorum]
MELWRHDSVVQNYTSETVETAMSRWVLWLRYKKSNLEVFRDPLQTVPTIRLLGRPGSSFRNPMMCAMISADIINVDA